MLPNFYDGMYLPDGDHVATWSEVRERFGNGEPRQTFCDRLDKFLEWAKRCNFVSVYLFGSFISAVDGPGDVDLLWVYNEIDELSASCRELISYENMKRNEGWDVFCCSNDDFTIKYLLEGWRSDKRDREKRRGVVIIDLTE
jgi:hypothetical protein